MCCPRCGGALAKWGYARERTVRALGAATVTVRPRRVRCRDCATTHILLPTALQPRRADTTEVIGTALAHKANGLGFRRIATRLIQLAPEAFTENPLRRQPVAAHADRAHRGRLLGSPLLRVRGAAVDADRHVHPRPAARSTPQRLKIESTGGHPCSPHGVTTPPTDRHRADDAVTAAITPSRWRPTPPSSSSSRVTASSSFSLPGNMPVSPGGEEFLYIGSREPGGWVAFRKVLNGRQRGLSPCRRDATFDGGAKERECESRSMGLSHDTCCSDGIGLRRLCIQVHKTVGESNTRSVRRKSGRPQSGSG